MLSSACKQTEFHQQSDCFACVLASHGTEKPRTMKTSGVYYRDHCICGVDEDTVTTKSIIETITGTEALQDKPKMLFVQVCNMIVIFKKDLETIVDDTSKLVSTKVALC